MNGTAVVLLVLGLVALNKVFGPGLTRSDRDALARRYSIKPLWSRVGGIAEFEGEPPFSAIGAHYDILADPQALQYVERRLAAVQTAASVISEANGIDTDEQAIIGALLALESLWELYWVNIYLEAEPNNETETVGEIAEKAFSDSEWLAVLPHLLNLPKFNEPNP